MDLRQLETFVRVVEAGGFSGAAAAMNVAQPTLSRQIALLEADLQQRLLVRNGRGATPTEAGAALLVHARLILDTARLARNEMHDLHANPGGRVTVGLPPRVAFGLSAQLVQQFRARFPRAVITVSEGLSLQLREWLISGRLDLALLFDPPASPQLAFHTVLREQLVLVASSRVPTLPRRVPLAALSDLPMVLPSAPNSIRAAVDAVVLPRHVGLQVVAEVGAVQTLLSLVAQGVGYAILPESALGSAARASHAFQQAAIGPPRIQNNLVLAIPRARPATRLTRETADLLRRLDFRTGL